MTGKTVTVSRQKAWYGGVRKVLVRIDGHTVDTLGAGESVTFEIPPDAERIRVSLDWVKSRPVMLADLPDEAELIVGSRHALLKITIAAVLGLVLGGWVSGVVGAAWTNGVVAALAIIAAMTLDPSHLQLKIKSPDPA